MIIILCSYLIRILEVVCQMEVYTEKGTSRCYQILARNPISWAEKLRLNCTTLDDTWLIKIPVSHSISTILWDSVQVKHVTLSPHNILIYLPNHVHCYLIFPQSPQLPNLWCTLDSHLSFSSLSMPPVMYKSCKIEEISEYVLQYFNCQSYQNIS